MKNNNNSNNNNQLLPETGFLRISQVLKLIPVAQSTWRAGVKSGRFPKGIKFGPRIMVWRAEDIRNLITSSEF